MLPPRHEPVDPQARRASGDPLAEMIAAARAAWPKVELDDDRFLAHVRARVPDGVPLETAAAELHASDLYLACACADGDRAALAAFELHYLSAVDRALRRLELDADDVHEVKQRVRISLFVAEDGPPRIAGYTGRGGLRSWLRVVAVHDAFAMKRVARRYESVDEDRLVDLACAGATPEVAYLKRLYRREFERAFRDAIQGLATRERTLIRQHFLDGVTVIELAHLYRVHRVTAARWLADARDALLASTRAFLIERLDVPAAEIEAILRLVLSQLEINLDPLFRRQRA